MSPAPKKPNSMLLLSGLFASLSAVGLFASGNITTVTASALGMGCICLTIWIYELMAYYR